VDLRDPLRDAELGRGRAALAIPELAGRLAGERAIVEPGQRGVGGELVGIQPAGGGARGFPEDEPPANDALPAHDEGSSSRK
jgi:hypothetical protein